MLSDALGVGIVAVTVLVAVSMTEMAGVPLSAPATYARVPAGLTTPL